MSGRPDYLRALAQFACGARHGDLPGNVLARTRWLVADTLPVIAAGMQEPEMQEFSARHLALVAPGKAWVPGTGKRAGALDAALLNGTAGTCLELNEGNLYAKGHPGIQVVPAAVALAQEMNASGAELLMAIAVGYETGSRISSAAQMKLAVHPHGTWGVICAAMAAARLKRFSEDQVIELLNVAATLGLATSRQTLLDGATVRNLFTGHAGHMGLMATTLVECGFTGGLDSAATVYGKVLADGFEPAKAIEGLGRNWLLADGYFKLHPTGRYVHSAIDALEDLLSRAPGGRIDPVLVSRMEVTAYKLCAMLAEKRVTSSFGARFSVPFALASVLHHGGSRLETFESSAVENPAIQSLAARVDMKESSDYTARYPAEQRCDLRITLQDGSVLEGHCRITKGESGNPHAAGELERKFFMLGTPRWGEATSRRLLEGCMKLEEIPDFGAFAGAFEL